MTNTTIYLIGMFSTFFIIVIFNIYVKDSRRKIRFDDAMMMSILWIVIIMMSILWIVTIMIVLLALIFALIAKGFNYLLKIKEDE